MLNYMNMRCSGSPQKAKIPICFLMMPQGDVETGQAYMSCCGKNICSGCCHAHDLQSIWGASCRFCRSPKPEKKNNLKRLEMRIKANDANAYFHLGTAFLHGDEEMEVMQDREKGLQLLIRGGELGSAKLYGNSDAHTKRISCRKDQKKARDFDELASIADCW